MTEKVTDPKQHPTLEGEEIDSGREDGMTEALGASGKLHKPTPESSYQNYLFGRAGASDTPAWSDSVKGRLFIRMFSRGILGAAFFTIGGRLAHNHLDGYKVNAADYESSLAQWKWDPQKPLQAVAYGIDATLGRGIHYTVRKLAELKNPAQAKNIADKALTFRETKLTNGMLGRSYGADAVGFTFDFAMASVGDALGRNLVQLFDPNVKKSWLVNDEGKPSGKGEAKHFVFGEWAKATGRSAWRIFSKNQGEDWIAAIPYAFQMKFQRQFISSILSNRFDGHQIVFDNSWNGGAYKVKNTLDKAGKIIDSKIVGDAQLAAAMDLHARFVGYNWYTLMFREGYDTISNAWSQWKENGFAIHPHLPQHLNPLTATIDGVGQAARYVTKSFIKANLYMNPAVVPFWILRVPQSKWKGKQFLREGAAPLNQQEGFTALTHIDKREAITIAEHTNVVKGELNPYAWSNYDHYPTATAMDKFEKGFSQFLNPFGWVCYQAGSGAVKVMEGLESKGWLPKPQWLRNLITENGNLPLRESAKRLVRDWVDASTSYTFYMDAKQELGLRVDDRKSNGEPGLMDKALYKTMDDIAAFKVGELGKDLKLIWKLGTRFERDIKVREGDVPDAQSFTKAPAPVKPTTLVQASTAVRHDPVNLSREASNDRRWTDALPGEHRAPAANEPDGGDGDRRWAKAVAGSDINPAQIHSSSMTRH